MRHISIRALLQGALLIGLGAVLGWWVTSRVMDARRSIGEMGELAAFAQVATVQYENADYDAAKSALSTYLDYLDAHAAAGLPKTRRNVLSTPQWIAADKLLVLARLALLEERHGNLSAADAFWARAEDEAHVAGWSDASRIRIREVVHRLDGQVRADPGTNRHRQ